jgi:hypothetical protein
MSLWAVVQNFLKSSRRGASPCGRLRSINIINYFRIQVFSRSSCNRHVDFVVQVLSILQKFGWDDGRFKLIPSFLFRRQCRHIIRNFQELLSSTSPKLSSVSASNYSMLSKSVHGCRSLIVQFSVQVCSSFCSSFKSSKLFA